LHASTWLDGFKLRVEKEGVTRDHLLDSSSFNIVAAEPDADRLDVWDYDPLLYFNVNVFVEKLNVFLAKIQDGAINPQWRKPESKFISYRTNTIVEGTLKNLHSKMKFGTFATLKEQSPKSILGREVYQLVVDSQSAKVNSKCVE
jgi:hypothetical protein